MSATVSAWSGPRPAVLTWVPFRERGQKIAQVPVELAGRDHPDVLIGGPAVAAFRIRTATSLIPAADFAAGIQGLQAVATLGDGQQVSRQVAAVHGRHVARKEGFAR